MEPLDIVEDVSTGFGRCPVGSAIDALSFETTEEAFDGRIVGAAADAAHAADQIVAF